MSISRGALLVLGFATCAIAVECLMYNLGTMRVDFSSMPMVADQPYFDQAFRIMSGICITLYVLLFAIGVQFIRGKTGVWPLLMFLLILEFFYFMSLSAMWMSTEYGMSIAAATGVANGGMMYQIGWWYPIWAPVVAFFASRSLERSRVASASPVPATS